MSIILICASGAFLLRKKETALKKKCWLCYEYVVVLSLREWDSILCGITKFLHACIHVLERRPKLLTFLSLLILKTRKFVWMYGFMDMFVTLSPKNYKTEVAEILIQVMD